MADQKIKTSANFTARQVSGISTAARRRGISDNDMLRRIVDDWLDTHPQEVASGLPQSYPKTAPI